MAALTTYLPNPARRAYGADDRALINRDHGREVRASLRVCPRHAETALAPAPLLAREGGVASVHVKAEWDRMGLGSFKALGGGLAVKMRAGEDRTFVCASAGNHGLAVAAAARAFGRGAVVYLSHAVPHSFATRLAGEGALVRRAGQTYEESLAAARRAARRRGWTLIADASRPGYLEPVLDVMRGYTVLFDEAADALDREGRRPSHVFLQAGVGGLAAAGAAYLRDRWGETVRIIVVEPVGAPCLFESIAAGRPVRSRGAGSRLGRLDCAEPSRIAFDLLSPLADAFLLITDEDAEDAAARLRAEGAPVSACGAAGAAGLLTACRTPAIARDLGLGPDARILLVGTEIEIPVAKPA
jgi:diaminopropionate ammonia-lyase